jgi:uncharacterized protein YutE (UPF0331/DUF86 family)
MLDSMLRRHAGMPLEALQDLDEAWAVQRGLQLCAQNALDVATHLLAGAGRVAPDYASALDGLGVLGVLSPALLARSTPDASAQSVLDRALDPDVAKSPPCLDCS